MKYKIVLTDNNRQVVSFQLREMAAFGWRVTERTPEHILLEYKPKEQNDSKDMDHNY